jgi:hypothetical protein
MDVLRQRYAEAKQADDARNTLIEDLLQKVDDMQKTMDRNAFVMVLIDGDSMNVSTALLNLHPILCHLFPHCQSFANNPPSSWMSLSNKVRRAGMKRPSSSGVLYSTIYATTKTSSMIIKSSYECMRATEDYATLMLIIQGFCQLQKVLMTLFWVLTKRIRCVTSLMPVITKKLRIRSSRVCRPSQIPPIHYLNRLCSFTVDATYNFM